MTRTLHPALQMIAALAILGVALGAAAASIVFPLFEALTARNDALGRLAKYEQVVSAHPVDAISYDPADLVATHIDDADAQLALQATIDRLARGAGVSIQSIQPMAAEHLGEIGRGVWVEMVFASDLQALVDFLKLFEAERPLLLVRRLEMQRGDGPRADLFMSVKIDIGRAWKPSGAPA